MRQRLSVAPALLLALALGGRAGVARAGGDGTAPASTSTRLALAPLSSLAEQTGGLDVAERTLGEGLAALPGVTVVSAAEVVKAARKAKRPELLSCESQPECLVETGKLMGAQVVVAGEVSELGESTVIYLKSIDVASGQETGSTTAVLGHDDAGRRDEARAAAVRLLAPAAYVGTLQLHITVPGASVFLDGSKVSASEPVRTAVGTHALRVTHEQHRDFVRFVDVKFDEVTVVDVEMAVLPVVKDEVHQTLHPQPKVIVEPPPWYRRWYTVAGTGVVLVAVTAVVVGVLASQVPYDSQVGVH